MKFIIIATSLIWIFATVAQAKNNQLIKAVHNGCKFSERMNRDDCYNSGAEKLLQISGREISSSEKLHLKVVIKGCESSGGTNWQGICYKKGFRNILRGSSTTKLIYRMCRWTDRQHRDDCFNSATEASPLVKHKFIAKICENAGGTNSQGRCYVRSFRSLLWEEYKR